MPESRSRTLDHTRPHSAFRFRVKVGAAEMGFAEVSGLALDAKPIEARAGHRAGFTPVKLASLEKAGTVVLKRGVLAGDPELTAWLQQSARGSAPRKTVTVTLISEAGQPAATWTLTAALPAKYVASDLNAAGNDIAIESLELSYEGLTLNSA